LLGACSLRGPGDIEVAERTRLKLPRDLVFLPPDEAVQLMHALGERPGARVLGAVLTTDETPRMLILFDGGRDERGLRKVDLVGWDDVPAARTYIEQLLIAQPHLFHRDPVRGNP
jgi:uncharacterized membrane-anchored protein